MHQRLVGGDDVFARVALQHGLQDLRRRPDQVGLRQHGVGRLRVRQHLGAGVLALQQLQFQRLELVVYDAGAAPQQHVGAGLLLDVAAQMAVGRPQHLLALVLQVVDDRQRAGAGHHPVGPRLDRSAGVGVDDDLAVGVGVAEGGELVGRAAQVERAGGVQVRHQHALVGRQDLGRLAHESHAGHDQRMRRVVAPEARHLERVGHTAAAGQRQVLDVAVDVVVRDQHRILRDELGVDAIDSRCTLGRRQPGRHTGPGLRGAGRAVGILAVVVVEGLVHGRRGRALRPGDVKARW